MAVEIGDVAPDFELPDQHGTPVKLSSFRGAKNVVLVLAGHLDTVTLRGGELKGGPPS